MKKLTTISKVNINNTYYLNRVTLFSLHIPTQQYILLRSKKLQALQK
jgi:hypothetical protein